MQFWVLKNYIKLLAKCCTGNFFLNFSLYYKYSMQEHLVDNKDTFKKKLKINIRNKSWAIVMQGPLINENDFTIETLKFYRKNYPDAILILSTWIIPKNIIKELKKFNIYTLENKIPEKSGKSNINMQIITSSFGILKAKELGAKYVLKTRTDQRIYHPDLDNYLFNLLKTFPMKHKYVSQNSRLIAVSLNTFKFRLYGISDMFIFGNVDDVTKYFNHSLDNQKNIPDKKNYNMYTWRKLSKLSVPEVFFCVEFLKKIGRKAKFTLRDSFNVFRDHFIIIDCKAIDLYWHKYTLNQKRYDHFGFYDPQLSFNDWLVLYNYQNSFLVNEKILDTKLLLKN